MTEEEMESELNDSYKLGLIEGLDLASEILLDEAELYFRQGESADANAKLMRKWSQIMAKRAQEYRDKREKERQED